MIAFTVESPSWLIRKEKFQQGLEILQIKYGSENSIPIAREFRHNLEIKEKRTDSDNLSILFSPSNVANLIAINIISLLKVASGFISIALFYPILLSRFELSSYEQMLLISSLSFFPESFAVPAAIKFIRKTQRNFTVAITSILSCMFLIILGIIRSFPFDGDVYYFVAAMIGFRISFSITALGLNEMTIDMIDENCTTLSLAYTSIVETFFIIFFVFSYSYLPQNLFSDNLFWPMSLFTGLIYAISNFWEGEKTELKRLLLVKESAEDTNSVDNI